MPGLKKHPPVYPWQYFDWCGPYISDGKFQSSRPGFTTARSAQEQRCKEHDIAYYYCKSQKCFEEADRRFSEASWGTSIIGSAQSLLVHYGGPYFHGEYSEDKKRPAEDTPNQPVKRLRGLPNLSGNKRPAPSNSLSQPKARRRVNFELPVEPPPEDPTGPAKMSLPAPSTGNGTQGEIGLKPFGKVANTQPDYFTTKFKWVFDRNITSTNGTLDKTEFRINSPYDPSIDYITAGDIRRNSSVNGWAIYADRYKYYRVVGVKAHISFHFPKGGYMQDVPGNYPVRAIKKEILNGWTKACGVNINPGRVIPFSSDSVSSWQQLAQNRYSNFQIIQGESTRADFEINYTPEMWATPVLEQQREQFWTPITQNPSLQDTYTVWCQALSRDAEMAADNVVDAGGAEDGVWPELNGHLVIMQEFTVQFREWSTDLIERSLFSDAHAVLDDALPKQETERTSETMNE